MEKETIDWYLLVYGYSINLKYSEKMKVMKLQRVAHKLLEKRIPIFPTLIKEWIHFRYNCDLPSELQVGGGTYLGHSGIGVVINKRASIGRNCIIAQNVTIAAKDGKAPIISDWVYVGANSVVLGGVNIGNDVFIGALTLVNKDVPDNAVVVGIPGKILRFKDDTEKENWRKWVIKNGGVVI